MSKLNDEQKKCVEKLCTQLSDSKLIEVAKKCLKDVIPDNVNKEDLKKKIINEVEFNKFLDKIPVGEAKLFLSQDCKSYSKNEIVEIIKLKCSGTLALPTKKRGNKKPTGESEGTPSKRSASSNTPSERAASSNTLSERAGSNNILLNSSVEQNLIVSATETETTEIKVTSVKKSVKTSVKTNNQENESG